MTRKHVLLGLGILALAGVVYWHFGHGQEQGKDESEQAERSGKTRGSAGKRRVARSEQAPTFDVLLDDDPRGELRLEGQVVDARLDPVAGAVVTIDSNPPRSTTSGEDGSFFFDELVGRPYRVVARAGDRFAGPVTVRLTDDNDPVILTVKEAARVEVHVSSAETGKPIAGAKVELRAVDTATSTSNQDGMASLRGMAPGRYWVMAVADGFAPNHSVLRIPGDTKVAEHDVELRRGAPVSGIVQTEQGKPVAGARVSYSGVSSWAQSGDPRRDAVLTDEAGRFRFPALPAGSFRFVARADGHAPGTSDIVTLNGSSEPSVVMVVVTAGATLAGKVVDKDGSPAASARVRVQVKTEGFNWGRPRQVYTDEDGGFEMRNLPAKTVEVAALHELGSSEMVEAELAPKSTANVTLELTRDGVIAGVVIDARGEPVEGAQVVGWPSFRRGSGGRRGGRLWGRTMELTDAGGRFSLRGLEPDGFYSLRANPPGASRRRMWYRESVEATVGDDDVELVLPEDGTVTGKIAFENGEAPEAFTVGIGFGAATPFSNRDGEFTLSDLPPRSYSITLRGIGFDDRRIPDVDVEAGKVVDLGTITVRRGRRISGRIVDADGSPVGGALIRAGKSIFGDGSSSKAQFGPPWARNAKETRSDEDGNFVISGLGPGVLSVVAEHDAEGRSRIVTVAPTDEGADLSLALQPWGALEGKVTRGGKEAAQVIVQAAMLDSPQVTFGVATGEDGRFRFDKLAPGVYKVSAMTGRSPMRGFGYHRKEVEVLSDKVASVELDIVPGNIELAVAIEPDNREAPGFAMVYVVRGALEARTARELQLAVGAAPSDVSFQAFSIRGRPATVRGLTAGSYTACANVFPTEVEGMGPTMAYIEREGDNLPVYCAPVEVAESPEEQSLVLKVTVPEFVPDQGN